MKGPVEVAVPEQETGIRKVNLSRNLGAEAIRYLLYSPTGASRVPLTLHSAAQGNFTPLAQAAPYSRRRIVATGSHGLSLSLKCAADLPWIKPGEGERLAANTFLGDYRLKQQSEACALWPRAPVPEDYSQPTASDAPVLILTGEWDPVTLQANGDAIAKFLPNSLHLVVPDGAHSFAGDRKSTRLNSSQLVISYAVFCLKRKTMVSIMVLSESSVFAGLYIDTYEFKGVCFNLVADLIEEIICLVTHNSAHVRKEASLFSS